MRGAGDRLKPVPARLWSPARARIRGRMPQGVRRERRGFHNHEQKLNFHMFAHIIAGVNMELWRKKPRHRHHGMGPRCR